MHKKSPAPRRLARRLALQALYQWHLTDLPIPTIEAQFLKSESLEKVDIPYFLELLREIPPHTDELDGYLRPILDRPLGELNPVELTTLRIGVYELIYRLEVPYRVIIDEALRLTKLFGTVNGFQYVNAILDKLATKLRPHLKDTQHAKN